LPCCGPFAEEGQNEGSHAKVGDSGEDGKVCLEDSKKTVCRGAKVSGYEILYKKRNSLYDKIGAGNESAYFYAFYNGRHVIKIQKEQRAIMGFMQ
jgi:hypothetical protein